MEKSARRTALIDFEASALLAPGVRSFPIEVAVGVPETGEVREWLIRPDRRWIREWTWSNEAEKVHGLTLDYLEAHGRPRVEVAHEVLAAIGDREPLSDAPHYDQVWLYALNGSVYPEIRVGSLGALLEEIAGGGLDGQTLLERAHAHAREVAPKTHRAAADVRHMMALLREALRLAENS